MRKFKAKINFYLQNPNKDGKCAINLHYRANNAQRKISTGIFVDPSWSEDNNTDELIQLKLDKLKQDIRQIELAIWREGREPTASEVVIGLKKPIYGRTSDNICTFISKWMVANSKKKSEATLYNYDLVKKYLFIWGSDITFQNMSEENLHSFEDWLISRKYKNSTVNQVMKSLLTIMKLADKSNIMVHASYMNYEPIEPKSENRIVALTLDEVNTLLNLELKGSLNCVRDMFVWACATGQRYSDVVNMKWSNVKASENKIGYYAVKTGLYTEVNLNKTSKAILEKNKGNPYPIPRKTNNKCNEEIKEICRIAGFDEEIEVVSENGIERTITTMKKWELVTFHTSRRSFATNCIRLGMPDCLVMDFTGHKDHKNFRRYIGSKSLIDENFMSRWDK